MKSTLIPFLLLFGLAFATLSDPAQAQQPPCLERLAEDLEAHGGIVYVPNSHLKSPRASIWVNDSLLYVVSPDEARALKRSLNNGIILMPDPSVGASQSCMQTLSNVYEEIKITIVVPQNEFWGSETVLP